MASGHVVWGPEVTTAFLGNEVARISKVSPLSILIEKGLPHIMLETCYRMYPAILKWPSDYFYQGKLRCHASVTVDNHVRAAMRYVSQRHYGLESGSECWFVDDVHGLSRVEPNGTLLQNYAAADAIATLNLAWSTTVSRRRMLLS